MFKFKCLKTIFLRLAKTLYNRGISQFLWFLLFKEKKKEKKKKITGISGFGFLLVQKWPFRDAHLFFSKKPCWNPYSVLGVRAFWAKLSKKGNFAHPPEKKNWLITEKLFFGIFFCVCVCVCVCFSLFFFFLFLGFLGGCFFGGFEGQVRWPQGLPHLAPNPHLFVFFWFFCWVFFVGGFKGQVKWPEGPPHLALNPPYLLFLFYWGGLFFPFFSLLFNTKKLFSPGKGHFCLFLSLSLCFSLAFLGLPSFQFLFLCLSPVILLSSSFLSFFCFILVPSFCLFLSFCFLLAFVSWKEQHQNN